MKCNKRKMTDLKKENTQKKHKKHRLCESNLLLLPHLCVHKESGRGYADKDVTKREK